VRREEEGIASGANNAIRELGGVFGVAVLGAVFSARGGYTSGTAFVAGLTPAVWVGAAVVAVAAAVALALPRRRRAGAAAITAHAAPADAVAADADAVVARAAVAAGVAAADAEPVRALGPVR